MGVVLSGDCSRAVVPAIASAVNSAGRPGGYRGLGIEAIDG
jgi:hypothetical protein